MNEVHQNQCNNNISERKTQFIINKHEHSYLIKRLNQEKLTTNSPTIKISLFLLTVTLLFIIVIGVLQFYQDTLQNNKNQQKKKIQFKMHENYLQDRQDNLKQIKEQKQRLDQIQRLKPHLKDVYKLDLSSRVNLKQPHTNEYKLNIWLFEKKQKLIDTKSCSLINAANYVTHTTIKNIQNLLQTQQIGTVFLIIGQHDFRGQYLIQNSLFLYTKKKTIIELNADYLLGSTIKNHCSKLVYIFGSSIIMQQMASNIQFQVKNLVKNSLFYTSRYLSFNKQPSDLDNLLQKDLSLIDPKKFYQYLYIFETDFLEIITPVNFLFYAKYTFEQVFLIPTLVLYQSNKMMYTSKKIYHGYGVSFIQFKQFSIKSVIKQQKNSICFVSYPNNPYIIDQRNALQYISGIVAQTKINKKDFEISVVLYLPYKFQQAQLLYTLANQLLKVKNNNKRLKIRLRITDQKAVSAYAVYDSVYTYCPEKSMILSSRHNVKFYPQLVQQIFNFVSQKYHYYLFRFQNQTKYNFGFSGHQTYGQASNTRWKIFRQRLHFFQIFKSDLMKTGTFWILKNAQIDFYQTEEVFVIHMMQLVQFSYGYINKTLASVRNRQFTQIQLKQMDILLSYGQYSGLISNQLLPYPYNCLKNKVFRRNAPKKIPANIHQIWFSAQNASKIRLKLQETIIQKNPNFTYYFWKKQNLTKSSAPITFKIVQKILQKHKYSSIFLYAMIADLLRYELLVTYGGLYLDFKFQGLKPLDNFLKYENLFIDCDVFNIRYIRPKAVGNGVIGATKNNYYLKLVLYQLISQQDIDKSNSVSLVTGGFVVRKSFTDQQLFTQIGFGYHLFIPYPYQFIVNHCGGFAKKIDPDQQLFQVKSNSDERIVRIGIPCKQYPESYVVNYSPLAKTWLVQKSKIK